MRNPFNKKKDPETEGLKSVPKKVAKQAAKTAKKVKDTAGQYEVDGIGVGGAATTRGTGVGAGVSIRKKKR